VLRSKDVFGRLNRLLRAMRPSFAKPDDTWAQTRLPSSEYRVYSTMDARDREHAVRVAKKLIELKPDASDLLVRAALLHDCGKQVRPYSWRERIWVGLQPLAKTDFDDLIRTNRAPTALEVRALHPQLGAALIRASGGDARVAQIVERHHQPREDADAAWIHAVDELE
jgi:putative nucleotidyltransferase with HDIG domain